MGTSADFGGPTGGDWTQFKRASANYVRYGGEKQRNRLLSTFARAVASSGGGGRGGGGSGGGGGGGRVGSGAVAPGQAVAAFGSDLANLGLDGALEQLGLGDLVGKDRFDVLGGLLDALLGDGSTFDEAHAKPALNEAIALLFPEDAQDYASMAEADLDSAGVTNFVETFIAEYVYAEMSLVLGKHMQKCDSQAQQQQLANDVREQIGSLVTIQTSGRDILQVDWRGQEGRDVLDAVVTNLQSILEVIDQ